MRESQNYAGVDTCGLAALRSQFSSGSSGLAAASGGWRAALFPSVSGDGFGADRSSLVGPRIVDDSHSYHPLMGSLPIFYLTGKRTEET